MNATTSGTVAEFLSNGNFSMALNKVFTNTSLAYRLWHRLDIVNLRHIFYLVTPYETIVPTLDDVPNYNIQVWLKFIAQK